MTTRKLRTQEHNEKCERVGNSPQSFGLRSILVYRVAAVRHGQPSPTGGAVPEDLICLQFGAVTRISREYTHACVSGILPQRLILSMWEHPRRWCKPVADPYLQLRKSSWIVEKPSVSMNETKPSGVSVHRLTAATFHLCRRGLGV